MDVVDHDKYMNAAAAYAVFVMTVSAASMYWLLKGCSTVQKIVIEKY